MKNTFLLSVLFLSHLLGFASSQIRDPLIFRDNGLNIHLEIKELLDKLIDIEFESDLSYCQEKNSISNCESKIRKDDLKEIIYNNYYDMKQFVYEGDSRYVRFFVNSAQYLIEYQHLDNNTKIEHLKESYNLISFEKGFSMINGSSIVNAFTRFFYLYPNSGQIISFSTENYWNITSPGLTGESIDIEDKKIIDAFISKRIFYLQEKCVEKKEKKKKSECVATYTSKPLQQILYATYYRLILTKQISNGDPLEIYLSILKKLIFDVEKSPEVLLYILNQLYNENKENENKASEWKNSNYLMAQERIEQALLYNFNLDQTQPTPPPSEEKKIPSKIKMKMQEVVNKKYNDVLTSCTSLLPISTDIKLYCETSIQKEKLYEELYNAFPSLPTDKNQDDKTQTIYVELFDHLLDIILNEKDLKKEAFFSNIQNEFDNRFHIKNWSLQIANNINYHIMNFLDFYHYLRPSYYKDNETKEEN